MTKFKKLTASLTVAAAVTAGLVIPVFATAAPASAMNVCRIVETAHTPNPKCNPKVLICTYYTYKKVCTRY